MEEASIHGWFTFIVRSDGLEHNEITEKLRLEPTSIGKKGEEMIGGHKMKDSYWGYKLNYEGYDDHTAKLNDLLHTLALRKEIINNLKDVYDVYIFHSLQSDIAQLGFDMEPDVIKMLADLNIRFETHILSFGYA